VYRPAETAKRAYCYVPDTTVRLYFALGASRCSLVEWLVVWTLSKVAMVYMLQLCTEQGKHPLPLAHLSQRSKRFELDTASERAMVVFPCQGHWHLAIVTF
jgi:hypothetical protein